MQRPPRFTLIEMLVVIAIISILASMLTPSLRRALDQARVVSCTNNLKQIGIMFHMYANDYEGHIPVSTAYGASDSMDAHLRGFFGMEGCGLEYSLRGYGGVGNFPQCRASGEGIWMCPAGTLSLKQASGGGHDDGYGYWSARRGDWTHAKDDGGRNGYQSAMYYMYVEIGSSTTGGVPPVINPAFSGRMKLDYFLNRQPLQYCSGRGEMSGWNGYSQGRGNHEHTDEGTEGPRPLLYVDGSVKALRYIAWLAHYESGQESVAYLHSGPYNSYQLAKGDAGSPEGLLPPDYPAPSHKPFAYEVHDP